MKRAITIIMACMTLLLLMSAFAYASSADDVIAEYLTADVTEGVAALPAEAADVDGIDTLYVPADATDLTGVFAAGKPISKLVLKGNAYNAASIQAVKDAAPITVYYNNPATGSGTYEALEGAEGVTLINLLGVHEQLTTSVNAQGQNMVYVTGVIRAKDLDYDDMTISVVFTKPGMDEHTVTATVKRVYTTVTGVASVNMDVAAASDLLYIDDAAYLYAVAIKGVPNGVFSAVATVTAKVGGVTVTSGAEVADPVTVPTHDHVFTDTPVAPNGEARGYTQKECTICGCLETDGPYDYSLYSGVDFENNGKFLIPFNFDNSVYTIEATVNVPTDYSGRPGVIVGNYGSGAGFNFEIYNAGKPRLYFAIANGNSTTAYNYYFNYDVRSDDPVNLALCFKKGEATLYADGVFIETIALGDFDIPSVGRTLVMGGDCRSGNSAAFKGTIYSVSIFRDYRTADEIKDDLILADANDANCICSYNLLDASVLGGGVQLSELEYAQATTAEELVYYASVGVKEIEVMNDIVLDRTVYVVADVTIYSNGNYTILRDPDFYGDMFVVGENSVGRNLILEGFICRLTFGKDGATGSLTVDGNKDNVTDEVYGTLVYINNSGVFNLTDQITLTNNRKTANSRTLVLEQWYANCIGGAAIVNINGTVNMNGGVISFNEVNFDNPSGGDSTAENNLQSCYGGAVFNNSNFVMNGGSIESNTGYYGGALTNWLNARVIGGEILYNQTSHAGGAIYNYNNASSELIIGSEDDNDDPVIFIGNSTTVSSGGAVYSGMKASLLIYGNTVFEDNSTYGSGGAIYVAGVCRIKGSTVFSANYAGSMGGAIYVTQDTDYYRRTVSITGAVFENNSASMGGAIGIKGSETYITDCVFTDNVSRAASSKGGGAIMIDRISETFTITDANDNEIVMEGQGADVTITGSSFTGNSANNEAGAIFGDAYCTVSVDDSTFVDNTAVSNGGAISVHGTTLTLTDNDFSGNVSGKPANDGDEPGAGSGGAVYASYRTITAATDEDPAVVAESSISISGGTFEGNRNAGAGTGGAVSLLTSVQDVDALTIFSVEFDNNESGKHGGAVYINNGNATLDGSVFNGNIAAENGGAVYTSKATLTGGDNSFFDNVSNNTNYGGGAIYSTNSNVSLTETYFEGNEAKNGGAVTGYTNSAITLTGVTATGNTARSQGGFAFVNGSSLTIANGTIGTAGENTSGNTSSSGGGAIYAQGGSTLNITDVDLVGNSTADTASGGTFYVKDSTAEFTGCTISGSTAKYGGAAIINGSNANFTDCTIEDCAAGSYGGALYIRKGDDDTPSYVTATGTDFVNNTVTEETAALGGAVYLNTLCEFEAVDCSFDTNSVAYTDPDNVPADGACGGAIFMNTQTAVTLFDTVFNGNTASTSGGAIYVSTDCSVAVSNGSFMNNSAHEGGAIFSDRLTLIDMSDVTFNSNTANGNGGAISSHGTEYEFNDCTFEFNTSGGNGAAFYASYRSVGSDRAPTTAAFTGGSFNCNNASSNGGAIYATVSEVTIEGTTFDGNSSSYGGALCGYSESTINAQNVTATSNTASRGSFAYVNSSTLSITGSDDQRNVFGDPDDATLANTSTGGGGLIFVENGADALIGNCDVYSSATNGSGGFLYAKAPVTVDNCAIYDTSAAYGGAMIVYGVDATVIDTVFDGCVSNSGMGGAIYLRQGDAVEEEPAPTGTLELVNVIFANCSAGTGSGGAIYGNANTVLTASDCTFSSNTAKNGGAVYMYGISSSFIGTTFTSNTATVNGGAINTNCDLALSDCTFDGNAAANDDTSVDTAGGAIYISKSGATFNVSGTSFTSNSAKDGGAVWMRYVTLEMTDVSFTNNTSTSSGGAAYIHSLPAGSFIRDITAQGNSSNMGGWAYMNRSTLTIEGAVFGTDDETLAETLGNSSNTGGVIYSTVGVDLTVNNTYFGYNSSKTGGAITGSNANGCAIAINDSIFECNSATSYGGAIYGEGAASFTVTGTTFTANTAPNGGAVYVKGDASYADSDCVYENNSATSGGGALYLSSSGAVVSDVSVFTGNTAKNGGAIYTDGQSIMMDITLNDATFTNNVADGGNGGAVYAYYINWGVADGAPLAIHGITAQGNTAASGGVFYINRATVCVDAGTYGALIGTDDAAQASTLGNRTTSSGGVSYHTVGGYLELDGVTVGYNTAGNLGGVAYVYHADGSGITANDSVFVGNSGKSGGAIYGANIAAMTFVDCDFTSNTATSGGGGALYAKDSAVVSCTGCNFRNNSSAASHGGVIYAYVNGTTVDFTDCFFEENTAAQNGGAIYNSSATVMTLTNVTLKNNRSTGGNGDAIFTTHGTNLATYLTIDGLTVDQPADTKTIYISQTNTNITIARASVVDLNNDPTDFTKILFGSSAGIAAVVYV